MLILTPFCRLLLLFYYLSPLFSYIIAAIITISRQRRLRFMPRFFLADLAIIITPYMLTPLLRDTFRRIIFAIAAMLLAVRRSFRHSKPLLPPRHA